MPEYSFRKEMESIDKWIGELRAPSAAAKRENTSNDPTNPSGIFVEDKETV